MAKYEATAQVEKVEWKAPPIFSNPHAVAVMIAIPAADFAGLDILRPFTITQEEA